jgi:nitrile hydratase subunit beta
MNAAQLQFRINQAARVFMGTHVAGSRGVLDVTCFLQLKNEYVPGHVRMPGYICGKTGVVIGISPRTPSLMRLRTTCRYRCEPTYDFRFKSRDLWPDSCDDALNHVGVFQSGPTISG